jgi:hypothetical protein
MSIDPPTTRESASPDSARLQAMRPRGAQAQGWRLSWGGALLTIALAGMAAFIGARLGRDQALPPRTAPLSDRVFDALGDGKDLAPEQHARINAIGERYASIRAQLRTQSRMLNVTLARLMAEESGLGPQTEATLAQLQVVMGERLKLSMQYMLEVRKELTVEQRRQFDRRVEEEALVSR